jgi:hypothetical protein
MFTHVTTDHHPTTEESAKAVIKQRDRESRETEKAERAESRESRERKESRESR